jgi:hypothetical protein
LISPKDKPALVKAKPKGKQRTEENQTITSDEGANCNCLKEAWRRAGYTPFNESAVSSAGCLFCFKAQS